MSWSRFQHLIWMGPSGDRATLSHVLNLEELLTGNVNHPLTVTSASPHWRTTMTSLVNAGPFSRNLSGKQLTWRIRGYIRMMGVCGRLSYIFGDWPQKPDLPTTCQAVSCSHTGLIFTKLYSYCCCCCRCDISQNHVYHADLCGRAARRRNQGDSKPAFQGPRDSARSHCGYHRCATLSVLEVIHEGLCDAKGHGMG